MESYVADAIKVLTPIESVEYYRKQLEVGATMHAAFLDQQGRLYAHQGHAEAAEKMHVLADRMADVATMFAKEKLL